MVADGAASLLDVEQPPTVICTACGSHDIRALWATFLFNSIFTVAQLFGSILSGSQALFSDTSTMFVDSATYLINILAEYLRIGGAKRRTSAAVDISAAGISFVALVAVAILNILESVKGIEEGGGDTSDSPNQYIMFGFTAGNLVIDIGMLGSILLRKRGGWQGLLTRKARASRARVSSASAELVASSTAGAEQEQEAAITSTADLNVFSALAHVIADTMRTVTEMACSILIWVYDNDKSFDGDKADNITALVVCAIIFAIALYVLYETVVQIKEEIRKRRTEDEVAANNPNSVTPLSAQTESVSEHTGPPQSA